MTDSNKYIFIDIRNSDEVLTKHFDDSKMTNYYNIPMNMIRFNRKSILSHLEWVDVIYIVCNSGRRSKFIKSKYFADEPRIVVDELLQFNKIKEPGQYNYLLENNRPVTIWVDGTFKYNLNNMTRIVQVVLGSVMLIVSSFMIFHNLCSNNYIWIMYILMIMGMVALYSGITRSCFMASLLMNVIN